MSGQLLVEDAGAPEEKHLHARFTFADDGPELRFVDQRTFGGMALADLTPEGVPEPIAHIAPDPLEPGLRPARPSSRRMKTRETRGQAGAARPDAGLGRGQHLRRRGALAGPGARRAALLLADQAGARPRPRPRARRHARGARRRAARASTRSTSTSTAPRATSTARCTPTARRGGRATGAARRSGVRPFMNRSSFSCPRCQPRPRTLRR